MSKIMFLADKDNPEGEVFKIISPIDISIIKKYSDDADFSGLKYDRDREEFLVKEVFTSSLLEAGEMLTSPYQMTDKFLRFVNTHPEFKKFLDDGLAQAILKVEQKKEQRLFETPRTVSWERVSNKLPNIFYDLIEVMESEKRRFS